MPANFVLGYVKLPKTMALNGVKGTIWQMNIDELVHPKVTVDKIEAQLSFWSLFTLNPSVELTFGDDFSAGPAGKLTISGLLSDITITDADIIVSADAIAQQMPLPVPLVASGDVKLSIDEFVMGKPICQLANGEVKWNKSTISALNETVKLGDLTAKLSCQQGALAVTIDDENDLGLSFVAYVRSRGVSGSGHLKPGAQFPEKLKLALPFLGKPDNQGRYRLSF